MTQFQHDQREPAPAASIDPAEWDRLMSKEFRTQSGESLKAIVEGQLDATFRQAATKKDRSNTDVLRRAKELATLSMTIAVGCMYSLEREHNGKKKCIVGPSIRLAEIMAYVWGSLAISAQKIGDDGRVITVQATAIDTITGNTFTVPIERRVTGRNGKRYSDDMVTVTTNAAVSLAIRNAILRVVPGALWQDVFGECVRVARGEEKTFATRRNNALDYFASIGIDESRVFSKLGVRGAGDIGMEELLVLTAIRNELEDDTTTPDRAFPIDSSRAINDRITELGNTNGGSDVSRPVHVPGPAAGDPPAPTNKKQPPAPRRQHESQPGGPITTGDLDEILGDGKGGAK